MLAVEGKYFDREILPVQAKNAEGKTQIWFFLMRAFDMMLALKLLLVLNPVTDGGVITAGNASQITDGAAAM